MAGRLGPVDQPGECRQKIVGDGAAQAAIGQFYDVLLAAGRIATAEQQFSVDTELTEFVARRQVESDAELALTQARETAADDVDRTQQQLRQAFSQLKDGTFLAIRHAKIVRDEHFQTDPRYEEPGKPLPAVRAPGEGASCLQQLAALAAA